jgi:hypothetical protein
VEPPNPLPPLVFASPLTDEMDLVAIEGVVPGASLRLTLKSNGKVIADTVATQAPVLVSLDLSVPLNRGDQIYALQRLGPISSKPVLSVPLISSRTQDAIPAPILGQPLESCSTSIAFANMIPSAVVEVTNGGNTSDWLNVRITYTGTDGPP